MKYKLKRPAEGAFLHSENNIIVKANDKFTDLSGYSTQELTGKSLAEIDMMLRLYSQINLESIESDNSCYMFTKEYEPREVTISRKKTQSGNEDIYLFKEKPNSRIEDKFPYISNLISANDIGVAIYGVPQGLFLKANDKFLDFGNKLSNKKVKREGKTLEETCLGYKGSKFEKLILNVSKTGKSFHSKEFKYEHPERGKTYWNISLVPIFVSGKMKYIIHTANDITESVVNRKIIEERNKELEAIIENISDGLLSVDKDHKYALLNNNARDFVYDPDSINKIWDTSVHTNYYDLEGNLILMENFPAYRVLNGERIKEFRLTCHRPDGIYHFNISGSPVYDKDGNVKKAILCARDVTAQTNKNQLIKTQKCELEAIVENIADEVTICDKNGQYIMGNKAFRKNPFFSVIESDHSKYLFEKVEFLDMEGNHIPPEKLPASRVVAGEKFSGFRIDIRYKNGTFHREISGTPVYDTDGNFIAGVLTGRDIGDRLKKEEALLLKTQYDTLNNIIENLDLSYVRTSYPEFRINYINNLAYRHLKEINPQTGPISSVIGESMFEAFKYNSHESTKIKKYIEDLEGTTCGNYFFKRKMILSGENNYFKVLIQPIFDIKNNIQEIVVVKMDITEEIEAKKKIEEVLKMQEEIFANVSHELKTPLNVIFCTNQLLELYLKNDSLESNKYKISKDLNIIKQNCYRFTKLINNIVDLSKIEAGFFRLNLSNENIVQITEDIVQSVSEYTHGKGIDIIFDTNTEEKIIACDPDKIERIILNLISNSIKFTNKGGSIFVNLTDKGDRIEISVRDTGIGMDKKYLNRIFKRFHQVDKSLSRNAEGSGIGLSMVKSIVELHGGNISAESVPGEGSIFKIQLPVKTVENSEAPQQAKCMDNRIEMINIEFSDIYSI